MAFHAQPVGQFGGVVEPGAATGITQMLQLLGGLAPLTHGATARP